MKLQRVLAKDSRSANEEAIRRFGPDVLVVSNARVNGMTELIVAVDVEPERPPASAASQPSADRFQSVLQEQLIAPAREVAATIAQASVPQANVPPASPAANSPAASLEQGDFTPAHVALASSNRARGAAAAAMPAAAVLPASQPVQPKSRLQSGGQASVHYGQSLGAALPVNMPVISGFRMNWSGAQLGGSALPQDGASGRATAQRDIPQRAKHVLVKPSRSRPDGVQRPGASRPLEAVAPRK